VREIVQSKQFKRDYKKVAASGRYSVNDFLAVVELLAQDKPLSDKHHDHSLKGDWIGYRECHINSDWLLIYTKTNSDNELTLVRTGSHSKLFS
jgi:mRNA interferase YafQ